MGGDFRTLSPLTGYSLEEESRNQGSEPSSPAIRPSWDEGSPFIFFHSGPTPYRIVLLSIMTPPSVARSDYFSVSLPHTSPHPPPIPPGRNPQKHTEFHGAALTQHPTNDRLPQVCLLTLCDLACKHVDTR